MNAGHARGAAVVACALASLVGVHAATSRPSSSAIVLHVAPDGTDSGQCTSAQPCRSLNQAYHVARAGQVIELAGGNYPPQRIAADPVKPPGATLANVVVRPAPRARVSIADELRVEGSHIEFHDLIVGDWYAGYGTPIPQPQQTAWLVFEGIRATAFYDHASHVDILGGSYGPLRNDAAQISDCDRCGYSPQHITLDGVTFHDSIRTVEGAHLECLHVYAASYLTIRRSRFYNCAIMDVFINNYAGSPDIHDILIENNWFDTPGSHGGPLSSGSYSLNVAPYYPGRTIDRLTIRNNTSLGTIRIAVDSSGAGAVTNTTVVGNLGQMARFQCVPAGKGVSYTRNVWWSDAADAGACGPTDLALVGGVAAAKLRDVARFDLHLDANSPAVGHGETGAAPSVDLEGEARPRQQAVDAGADQREPALVTPGRALGAVRMGGTESAVRAFYGAPTSSAAIALGRGSPRRTVFTYRLHAGTLWVAYAGHRVVGLGTTSPFYATAAGAAVGARLPTGTRRCTQVAGVTVTYELRNGVVDAIRMVRRPFAGPHPCA